MIVDESESLYEIFLTTIVYLSNKYNSCMRVDES